MATFGEAEVDEHTQKADIDTYVGGVTFETTVCNTFVGFALISGYVVWNNDRYVMNNLADGGVQKAHADLNGFFISPELTLVQPLAIWCHPIASFTLRYAGLFLGSYHEKGSDSNLMVKDREIDLLTTRFELAVQQCCFTPYIGVFGRYQVGGNRVNAKVLEESITFDQEGPSNLAAFLLGLRGEKSVSCFDLFFNIEASFDNSSSTRILGEGGIGWCF